MNPHYQDPGSSKGVVKVHPGGSDDIEELGLGQGQGQGQVGKGAGGDVEMAIYK